RTSSNSIECTSRCAPACCPSQQRAEKPNQSCPACRPRPDNDGAGRPSLSADETRGENQRYYSPHYTPTIFSTSCLLASFIVALALLRQLWCRHILSR